MSAEYTNNTLPEDHKRIVSALIDNLDNLSKDQRARLRRYIQVDPVPGYKDSFKAPPPRLKLHISDSMNRRPIFASGISEIWAQTLPELRLAAAKRLDDLPTEVFKDAQEDPAFWEKQVAALAQAQPEHDKNDVLIMMKVCHTQKLENARESNNQPDPPEAPISGVLSLVIEDYLRPLPAHLPEWENEIPNFLAQIAELVERKKKDRQEADKLDTDLQRLQENYATECAFFGNSNSNWDVAHLPTDNAISQAKSIITELAPLLQEYRPVSQIAPTYSEEQALRRQRQDLEAAIAPLFTQMNDLIKFAAQSAASSNAIKSTQPGLSQQIIHEANIKDLEKTQKEISAELHDIKRENARHTQERDAIKAENARLQADNEGLTADLQQLKEENSALQTELYDSENQANYWRNQHEAATANSKAPLIPAKFDSIAAAIEFSEERHPEKLLINLNRKSDTTDFYHSPNQVWGALDWLATTYHDAQTGESPNKDLDASLRQVCSGWSYSPHQSEDALNRYTEWYETTVGDKTYTLRKHISKGVRRGAKNIIRIAFEWDDENRRVVVGYIGPHQQNRQT